ncbi:MAG: hypothetical protein CISAcid_12570 [uncultured Acidilobus sp. CIS]|nr:MAG: hypothetical protein CISAcid_12570 [uncultured Acidilobus sp. CIS]
MSPSIFSLALKENLPTSTLAFKLLAKSVILFTVFLNTSIFLSLSLNLLNFFLTSSSFVELPLLISSLLKE